jgi:glyoxalase family protein
MKLAGLHHVTCVCSDAQRTLDFYRDLGFTLVKKTVNFDDPHSYHLYFGDETGAPGSLITFFEWPRAERGRLGRGTLDSIGLELPGIDADDEVEDPDGLRLRLYPGTAPRLHDVLVIGNPDLYAGLFAEGAPLHFAEPVEEPALIGAGTTHHIAWRAKDDAEEEAWLERLTELGLRPTPVQDRKYFHSIYFRMPDGVLIEIATDEPGFLVDEPRESLGQGLSLPPWLEPERETLERELAPID